VNNKGFSLAVASGIIIIIALLCMVSLVTVVADATLTGGLYSQSITLNAAESGIHQSIPTLLDDAGTNFTTILQDQGGAVLQGSLNYPLIGTISFDVNMRDNDDLDGDTQVDTDKRIILNGVGTVPSGGRTELEVLLQYLGTDDEYAQETGGSRSDSHFSGETEVSDLIIQAVGTP
jgi:hypothetical protein